MLFRSAAVADGVIGDRHDSNTELIAQGAANIIAPLFGGIPATGAIASTVPSVWLFRFFRVASIVPSEDSFELMHSALGKLRANARSLFLMRF